MSNTIELEPRISAIPADFVAMHHRKPLDMSPDKFGLLRDSSDAAFQPEILRDRMAEDGYLFLPGLLNRAEVLEARRVVAERLLASGNLEPGTDSMDCIASSGPQAPFRTDVTENNAPLMKVLYDENGPMMAFWARFFGESVRHFDYTWFRAVAPGTGTLSHTDAVYMNRGTSNLFTAWTPIGDVPLHVGGLMVLEGSHKHEKLRNGYSSRDVDTYCTNKPNREHRGYGGGNVRSNGVLSNNPVSLREAIGGRWLTSEFRAGDLLCFSIYTVHASLDNGSNHIRLSSDSRYQRASEPVDERFVGPNPIAHGPDSKRGTIC